jgi:peptidoglycan hydrolase-like protein with peptidoglycan-binding domain
MDGPDTRSVLVVAHPDETEIFYLLEELKGRGIQSVRHMWADGQKLDPTQFDDVAVFVVAAGSKGLPVGAEVMLEPNFLRGRTVIPVLLQEADSLPERLSDLNVIRLQMPGALDQLAAQIRAGLSLQLSPAAWPTSTRDQIAAIQSMLRDLKLLTTPADGMFGPVTQSAILEFERREGLKRAGEPSRELFETLKKKLGPTALVPPPPAPPGPSRILEAAPRDERILTAGLRTDSPRQDAVDSLDVEGEAQAFARVATARQVTPPLAFGVFGHWGSGKSFFMELMQKHVAEIADETSQKWEARDFHKNVVQIRFNAWHYVESNLWASLIDYIFVELDRWAVQKRTPQGQDKTFEKLATARELTFQSAERLMHRRKEQKDATDKLTRAQQDLATARQNVENSASTVAATALQVFWTQEEAGIRRAATTLGLDRAAESVEGLQASIDDLRTQGTRARVEATALVNTLRSGRWMWAILAVVVLVPVLVPLLRETILAATAEGSLLHRWVADINQAMIGAATGLTALAGLATWASKGIKGAIAKLQGYRTRLDQAIAARVTEEAENARKAQEDLKAKTAQVVEAQSVLASTRERLAEAAREYVSQTGHARLMHFVRERATGATYAKHLGLIAAARKDFTELSAMMTDPDDKIVAERVKDLEAFAKRVEALIAVAQSERLLTDDEAQQLMDAAVPPQPDNEPHFQRIILYVDDLDRCPPDTVIDVLQAVHLLLTFPLFVVVVAVDTRWVSRSLLKHYDKLLSLGGASTDALEAAAPRDYLEKIFQVPYWVRPMTEDHGRDLLKNLGKPIEAKKKSDADKAKAEVKTPAAAPAPAPAAAPTMAPTSPGPTAGAAAMRTAVEPQPLAGDPQVPSAGDARRESEEKEKAAEKAKQEAKAAASAVVLEPYERAFMDSLAGLIGDTPRRALRFVNVYRVIKASLDPVDLFSLHDSGDYRAIMTELAITTGVPDLQEKWWSHVDSLEDKPDKDKLSARVRRESWLAGEPNGPDLCRVLEKFEAGPIEMFDDQPAEVETAVHAVKINGGIGRLKHYSEIVRRYSFREPVDRTAPPPATAAR